MLDVDGCAASLAARCRRRFELGSGFEGVVGVVDDESTMFFPLTGVAAACVLAILEGMVVDVNTAAPPPLPN